MKRVLFTIGLCVVAVPTYGATCDAGFYLQNGTCKDCISGYYCPGDDNIHSCIDIAVRPDNMSIGLISLNASQFGPANATSADDCQCQWALFDDTCLRFNQYNQCNVGPAGPKQLSAGSCRPGFYASGKSGPSYTACIPCTNAPDNTVYVGNGTPGDDGEIANNCKWECADGYSLTSGGVCAALCPAGVTTLHAGNNVSTKLYATRQTSPSLNITTADGATCHAELLRGIAKKSIVIDINGSMYHTYSPDTSGLMCDAGYYLNNNKCENCGKEYYCVGDNVRRLCRDLVPADTLDNMYQVISLSNGSWANTENATGAQDCVCHWSYSDERRTQYMYESRCHNGPQGSQFTRYNWCRTGYYATNPVKFNNWYTDCEPCTNGPAHSHYTSYSTPSVMYAVESNCPWECDNGYTLIDGECIAE